MIKKVVTTLQALLVIIVFYYSSNVLAIESDTNSQMYFVQPKGTICEGWEFRIEPDFQITDRDLTEEKTQEALKWLKGNITTQGHLYSFGKKNRLKIVKGFALKSDVLNSQKDYKKASLETYCKWLRDEGFWYD